MAHRLQCDTNVVPDFKPLEHQQVAIDHFENSDNRGFLLYHAMGSGKCVVPTTTVTTVSGNFTIKELWDNTTGELSNDDVGTWKTLNPQINVPTFDGKSMYNEVVPRLYRQLIDEDIVCVKLSNGVIIKMTRAHKILTSRGYTNDLYITDIVQCVNPQNEILKKTFIVSITTERYQGYVYDLEVSNTHNYVANGIITHNTCSMYRSVENYVLKHPLKPATYRYVTNLQWRPGDPEETKVYQEMATLPVYMTIFVFLPASLLGTHKHEYCKVCGVDPLGFSGRYNFYAYNAGIHLVRAIENISLDNSVIIVDEVQTLLNGKRNDSATVSYLYDKILRSHNSKILLLSGTPIFNDYSFVLLINLISKRTINVGEADFTENFATNDEAIYKACKGLISYVPQDESLFPEVLPEKMDKVFMSDKQYAYYKTQREVERNWTRGKMIEDKKGDKKAESSYVLNVRVLSRRACNYVYPHKIEDEIAKSEKHKAPSDRKQTWLNYNTILPYIKDMDDIPTNQRSAYDSLKYDNPKMYLLFRRLLTLPGKHMVFGWTLTNRGLFMIEQLLINCGISPLLYTGVGNEKDKTRVLETFNRADNINGDVHKVILISVAGAMGITLLEVRHVHIFEASPNEFISVQAIGRAIRTNSHARLPLRDRNVQVYRYLTCLTAYQKHDIGEELSSEELIFQRGMERKRLVEHILDIMKYSAIDCNRSYNRKINDKCHEYTNEVEEHGSAGGGRRRPRVIMNTIVPQVATATRVEKEDVPIILDLEIEEQDMNPDDMEVLE
jgi:hypothetical protein